jgi:phosphonate transport system ATP-binding protein
VDLALKWFDRIVGLRAGASKTTAPAAAVSRTMLQELYATEGSALPTQAPDFVLEEPRAPVLPGLCR